MSSKSAACHGCSRADARRSALPFGGGAHGGDRLVDGLDAGANDGQDAAYLAALLPKRKVIAVEPLRNKVRQIKALAEEHPNLIVVAHADLLARRITAEHFFSVRTRVPSRRMLMLAE